MNNTVRTLMLGTVAAVMVGFGAAAYAQGPDGPGPRGPRGAFGPGVAFRGLDLTDAQRDQIRTLTEQYRASTEALREQLRNARDAQQAALATNPVNEGQIRAATQALAAVQGEVAIMGARLRADAMTLLTPDQRAAFEARRAEIEERRQDRDGLRQRRPGPRPGGPASN